MHRRIIRPFRPVLACVILLAVPASASACPGCATPDARARGTRPLALGALMLLPFAVVGGAGLALRRRDGEST